MLNAAHRSDEAAVRLLNGLGKPCGAAAEQQCSGICWHCIPQPERRFWLGDEFPDVMGVLVAPRASSSALRPIRSGTPVLPSTIRPR